jgi:hypothetical protein
MAEVGMCPECYAPFNRITPLINPEDCLKNHRQYICQTCGRYICAAVSVDKRGKKYRARFPFRTLEIAKLYLRSAEVIEEKPCGIYEVQDDKAKKSYKIFSDRQELENYLQNNIKKKFTSERPLYVTGTYRQCAETQLRRLTKKEIDKYLKERKDQMLDQSESTGKEKG